MVSKQEEHWSSEAYQNSASFVPKLATKVLGWLDVKPDDVILDIGCGDGVLNLQIAEVLKTGSGRIHGTDSSEAMIAASQAKVPSNSSLSKICTFEVVDATRLIHTPSLQESTYDKVFSNAAMHWILRPEHTRAEFFKGAHGALKPGGAFVFEMGGMGCVAEIRTVLLAVVGRRVGIQRAREADPWFFPDEHWMRKALEGSGFGVERIEREYRPTEVDKGGVEGWVRLMGKQFLDAVENGEEREKCLQEVMEILETVCRSPEGGDWLGYVRLRAVARKL
ncbi:S-adenosyl-L-methionine-dependent methyltransferase [Bisporella sp. PMI_857]|nr:S-adenosyl-L-methionine-dependent methyltransferase [Bisporella sp. PMI_857]